MPAPSDFLPRRSLKIVASHPSFTPLYVWATCTRTQDAGFRTRTNLYAGMWIHPFCLASRHDQASMCICMCSGVCSY